MVHNTKVGDNKIKNYKVRYIFIPNFEVCCATFQSTKVYCIKVSH